MYDDAKSFSFLGAQVYVYGLFIAVACALMLAALTYSCRKKNLPKGTAALLGALGIPIGLVCSRVLFCLLDSGFRGVFSPRALLSFWGGGLSMTGALLGAALAALLTARIQKISALDLLDALTPALLAFMAVARFGEPFTNDLLGRSRALTVSWLRGTVFSSADEYGIYRLDTWLIEALCAALLSGLLIAMLRKGKRRGEVLLTGMLLLGCIEVFWHSMRTDAHMFVTFVNLQQIIYACMFAAALIVFARRCGGKALWIAVGACLLDVGAIIGLEFLIDRSSISHVLLYIPYALLMAGTAALGLIFRKRSERA
ncbi:MAG: prolipoprotein diacylglyceryl transferase [Clostridia bacterium]|nr:prolipoprotein diacylglyceryl transferase [Clostridia bacterium]